MFVPQDLGLSLSGSTLLLAEIPGEGGLGGSLGSGPCGSLPQERREGLGGAFGLASSSLCVSEVESGWTGPGRGGCSADFAPRHTPLHLLVLDPTVLPPGVFSEEESESLTLCDLYTASSH